ncbi:MAG TPA: hydrogenase expression/formation C-terminal domain-containing protein [Methylomusa anaerophila]|uniref:HupH hydrogenase expression protein C-terminal domain-containing protein n=1 Tax=Methylomusa anaerophila TaxID=1930071 RepID=A0A348ANV1_9FIRM|nr:hydrogenase expression/formation C-terminal domain-containing protein [Methylomusa anaerophila]BBB92749.1 hypothetical protein MAMMFC1_03445 [Methylomusa anaerophila]HML87399.1 hydrogenase expression/formation C-terminal domain-containing protein [Methylomusa anaerophila]
MNKNIFAVSNNCKAVLVEIAAALERLLNENGEDHTIFIDKMGLTQEERQAIKNLLGTGDVRIHFEGTAEPAEWLESGIAGVWFGVYYDPNRRPLLETIEICRFPQVAAAQKSDISAARERLKTNL